MKSKEWTLWKKIFMKELQIKILQEKLLLLINIKKHTMKLLNNGKKKVIVKDLYSVLKVITKNVCIKDINL